MLSVVLNHNATAAQLQGERKVTLSILCTSLGTAVAVCYNIMIRHTYIQVNMRDFPALSS